MAILKIKVPSLPLLGKELIEQANRARTYALRILLLGIMLTAMIPYRTRDALNAQYLGDTIFTILFAIQFVSVLVFLPAMMAGVLTMEKERNSLELLLLTRMKPIEIILQKYLSRIIPMLSFFLLSLPLLAVAYSLGGVGSKHLTSLIILSFLSIFYVGAFSIMLSAYCASTVAAVISSYLAVGVHLAACIMINLICRANHVYLSEYDFLYPLFIVMAMATPIYLLFSVHYLKTRPLACGKFHGVELLKSLDKFWKELNKLFYGIELFRSRDYSLPDDGSNPLDWYDHAKSTTGTFTYQIRMEVAIMVAFMVVLFISLLIGAFEPGLVVLVVAYACAIPLILSVRAASILSLERSENTLDILLTTPLSAADIVRCKMRGNLRLMIVLLVPPVLVALIVAAGIAMLGGIVDFTRLREIRNMLFCIYIFCHVILYLQILSWFSCWIGLVVRNQLTAIMVSLSGMVIWCVMPAIFHECVGTFTLYGNWSILFPTGALINDDHVFRGFIDFLDNPFASDVPLYTLILFLLYLLLRRICIGRAEKYLGRG